MSSMNSRTMGRRYRSLFFGGVSVLLATVLVSGCVGPDPAPASAAFSANDAAVAESYGGSAAAESEAASAAAAESAAPESRRCAPGLVLEDEQQVLAGGAGGTDFTLTATCDLQPTLTLRAAAGRLSIRLEGPTGTVFEHNATAVVGLVAGIWLGSHDEAPGRYPAGTYRYTFETDAMADFRFEVEASA